MSDTNNTTGDHCNTDATNTTDNHSGTNTFNAVVVDQGK